MNKLRARILPFASLIVFSLFAHFCSKARAEVHSWVGKIVEAKEMLRDIELKHSNKLVSYKEIRKSPPRNKKKKARAITIKRTDYAWKEAGLALINTKTGEMQIVKIRKDGQKLNNYSNGFVIKIEPRINGITWNGRNTAFRVVEPVGWAVIANKWIEQASSKTAESVYFPYSTATHQDELVGIGGWHLDNDAADAFAELRFKDVKSLVFPEKMVGDVVPPEFPKNLVLVELTDPQEFYAYKSGDLKLSPFNRVKVLLAGNGEGAFPAYNYAGAVGLTQFTNNKPKRGRGVGTWDVVRGAYLTALLPEFKIGATNHIESIKAAILLYDYNLDKLVRAFGSKILDDKNLELYLYAAHNCGISRVIEAIKHTKRGQDWRVALRKLSKTDETIMFLDKVGYLLAEKNG